MTSTRTALIAFALFAPVACAQSWGTWETGPSLPTNGDAKTHAIGLERNGMLYVLGGPPWINGGDGDGSVYSMPVGAAAWTEELGFDGIGYVLGQGGGVDDLGRIIIFGGDDPNDPGGYSKPPFEWDPVEGPWHEHADRGPLAPPTNFASCTDQNGRLYSIGGGPGEGASSGDLNSTYCERFIGSLDVWEPIAPMPVALAGAAATPDGLGHILVFGGVTADGSSRTTGVLQYDLATDAWSSTANADMPEALSDHRAVLGSDGRVYIIGGVSGAIGAGMTRRSTYVYNPATDIWQVGPDMAEARRNFAAISASDSRIYVVGGENDTGGSFGVELLYTTLCPVVSFPPQDTELWANTNLAMGVEVTGGTPITYQWLHDGVPLTDGASPGGATVSGAQSSTLVIESVGAGDAGMYAVVASNACGDTTSAEAFVSVRMPPAIPQHWTWTSLHPSYAQSSSANAVDNGVQVGRAVFDTPDYNNIDHPTRWAGSAASAQNLTPGGSQGGNILDFAGDKLVGWWWEPLQCYVGGQWLTCYYRRACWWNLNGTFHQTSYSGFEYTLMSATDGVSIVGSASSDDASGNVYTRGVIWQPPTHEFAFSIHPLGYNDSNLTAVDGDDQYGNAYLPFAVLHAGKWSGTAGSFVDMHPEGYSNSSIVDASDGQQVGVVNQWSTPHAVMWTGTPGSLMDLNPPGAAGSTATACEGGLQIGSADFNDGLGARPGIWAGRADTFVDLSGVKPAGYSSFSLVGIDVAPDGTISLVGTAHNTDLSRSEAVLLTSSDAPACPADLDGNGTLNLDDINLFASAFVAGDLRADMDGNGALNLDDINLFAQGFGAGCP